MLALWIPAIIAVLDQWTKYVVRVAFHPHESVQVIPGLFDLTYVRNTGAAWGIMGGMNEWLVLLSVLVLVGMVAGHRALVRDHRLQPWAMGLIAGGIVGNLFDRLRLGFVVDFVDVYWGPHHFPAFNIADAAICCGVTVYLLTLMLTRDSGGAAAPAAAP